MDLLLIAIVTFVLLAATIAAIRFGTPWIRKLLRHRLEKALTQQRTVHTQRLSIYDVFWDLGATENALDFMIEHHIVPATPRQKRRAFHALNKLVKTHGSYTQFIESSLIDIEENPHINELALQTNNVISIYEVYQAHYDRLFQQDSDFIISYHENRMKNAEVNDRPNIAYPVFNTVEPPKPNKNYLLAYTLQDRQRFRITGESDVDILILPQYLYTLTCPEITDATQLDGLDTDAILRLLFTGTLSTDLQKWSLTPYLQNLKSQLDGAFEDFYEVYQDLSYKCISIPHNDILIDLRETSFAWTDTAEPMITLLHEQPWNGLPWETSAEILITKAQENIFKLSNHAELNTLDTMRAIHELTDYGHNHLAGYALYVNRHKIYGKSMDYKVFEDDIESITYFIQTELRKVLQKHVA